MRRPPRAELQALEAVQRTLYYDSRYKLRHRLPPDVSETMISPAAVWMAYRELGFARGRRTAGVDGLVYEGLEPKLVSIVQSIRDGSYKPAPLKVTAIPKANGGTRQLQIPTIADRFVQRLVLLFVAAIVERLLPLTSFACRPGFGAGDALRHLELCLHGGGDDIYLVRADIEDFFAHVQHPPLREMLREHLRGEGIWYVLDRQLCAWQAAPERGLPQGAPLSPALANLYLHGVDHAMTFKPPDGVVYIRYMDDIALVVRGGSAKAEQVLEQLRGELGAVGLRLNDKTLITPADQGIDFLGLHLRRVGDKVDVCANGQSLARLKSRIDESVVGVDQSPPGGTSLRGDAPDVGQTKVRKETVRKETRPERGLEETIPEQSRIEETTARRETPELDSAVIGFANYYTPHDHRVWQEICWYYFQRTGRWLDHGSGRDRPSRKGVPSWMLRLPGDRCRVDRKGGDRDIEDEGVVGDTWLRPTDVATRSSVGLAANPEGPAHEEGTTFLVLMGLRAEPGDDETQGLPDLDLGDSMRKAAGARRWLGAALGKAQQAISDSRRSRKAMRVTATRTLEGNGYVERSLVDAALDRSPAYCEALREEHRLGVRVQRLRGQIGRADIFSARLETEVDRRRQRFDSPSPIRRGIYAAGLGVSPARVDMEGLPSDVSVRLANLNATLTNLVVALFGGGLAPPWTASVMDRQPADRREPGIVSAQSSADSSGWSSEQIAKYLAWLASGEFLLSPSANGRPRCSRPSSKQQEPVGRVQP